MTNISGNIKFTIFDPVKDKAQTDSIKYNPESKTTEDNVLDLSDPKKLQEELHQQVDSIAAIKIGDKLIKAPSKEELTGIIKKLQEECLSNGKLKENFKFITFSDATGIDVMLTLNKLKKPDCPEQMPVGGQELLDKLPPGELKDKTAAFLKKTDSPEAVKYLNDFLFNQHPPLSADQQIKIMDKLAKMLDTQYDSKFGNAKDFVVSLLKDISQPLAIWKTAPENTDSAVVQSVFAMKEPAKYLDMMDNLAQNKTYATNFGVEIKAAPEANSKDSLFQNSVNTLSQNKVSPFSALMGVDNIMVRDAKGFYAPEQFFEMAKPSADNHYQVLMKKPDGPENDLYMVSVIGMDKEKGTVRVINPDGKEESIPLDKFGAAAQKLVMSKTQLNPMANEITDRGDYFAAADGNALKTEISEKLPPGELKDKTEALMAKFPNDNEAVIYLNEFLFNRKPPMTEEQKIQAIDKFTKMLETNYDPRVGSNRDLVVATMHDIAAPADITQGRNLTCVPTTIQAQLAIRDPLQYISMVDTLAQDKPFKTLGGKSIKPNWTFAKDNNKDGIADGKNERNISSCLLQNSLMDFGDGSRKFDSSASPQSSDNEQVGTSNTIFNQHQKVYDEKRYSHSDLVDLAEKSAPSAENPLRVTMQFNKSTGDALHAVNVTGMDKEKGTVTIINPWGREETMPIKAFEERIHSVVTDQKPDKKSPKGASTIK
jgi:hypothetical protein